jgi:hypothetical protein
MGLQESLNEEEIKRQIAHLELLRQDARDEIKRRIEQRDKYSIQLTIAIGAILAFSIRPNGSSLTLIAIPIVSIYFTVLILYSYKIHNLLATYLKDKIETKIAKLCNIEVDCEWENYYKKHEDPGIRRGFFILALWAMSVVLPIGIFIYNYPMGLKNSLFIGIAGVIFIIATIAITAKFRDKKGEPK